MTEEERNQLKELIEWKQKHEFQQLLYPVDDASKDALGFRYLGPGNSTLTQVYTDSRGDTVTAPKAYAGSVFVFIDGRQLEIPFI